MFFHPHNICKQYLNVEFKGTAQGAETLRGKIDASLLERLSSVMETVFDRHAADNVTLQFERLEIDAGSIHLDHIDEELLRVVAESLDRILRECSRSSAEGIREASASDRERDNRIEPQVSYRRKEEKILEAFLFFLQYGALPWWSVHNQNILLEKNIRPFLFSTTIFSEYFRFFLDRLSATLSASDARKRLVTQYSACFVVETIGMYSGFLKNISEQMLVQLRSDDISHALSNRIEKKLLECAISASIEEPDSGEQEVLRRYSKELERSLSDDTESGKVFGYLAQTQEKGSGKPVSPEPFSSHDKKKMIITQQPQTDDKHHKPQSCEIREKELADREPESFPDNENLLQKCVNTQDIRLPEHPDRRTGIYVGSAGLVLLHPFLPRLFTELAISDGFSINNPKKAFLVLHHLASGRMEAMEHELGFNKILCGNTPESVAEKILQLTAEEAEECDAMLKAVIGHWRALKGTGIETFRETFLKRKGKITQKDSGDWLLQVESSGVDILLDHLPWGIGTVRLPWMPSILWVEWPS